MTTPSFEPLTAERRRQQTRDYLLKAAAQVFAQRGFHAATIDEVAAAAGFTKGAVYSNFKSKEDLFLALLESAYAHEMASLRQTYESSEVPPSERLEDFAGLIRTEVDRMPDNWGALYLEFTLYAMRNPEARQRLNALEAADIRAVAELIAEAGDDLGTDPMHAARIVTALFRGVSLMRELAPETVGPEFMTEALSFVARALGA
ncbi:MAG TPA: TetR/AcrR family transcriptional regulator [Acidimicrobiales bacterium]|nr:TetR/AcrR family transcriptional regulator [Acidimicrobiales bacterium]